MTLLLLIILITVLILVHELGHFYAARMFGVRVDEFGIGFPPRIYSRMRNGVRYSLNLFPIGGFVKIFGEGGEGAGSEESFASRPIWQRCLILAAGVIMNFVTAWVFFTVAASFGSPTILNESQGASLPISIIDVAKNSPAHSAGFRFGDQILEIRSVKEPDHSLRVETDKDIQDFVSAYRGEEILFTVRRGSSLKEITVTPRISNPENEGALGIALGRLTTQHIPLYMAPIQGLRVLGGTTIATVQGLSQTVKDLFIDRNAPIAISGPVGIFRFAQDMRSLGAAFFLNFIGIISVSLAILNILPIPALDGGRILFCVIEKIRGVRMKQEIENTIHGIGFLLLMILIVVITYHDIVAF